jgi:hypothetical protein
MTTLKMKLSTKKKKKEKKVERRNGRHEKRS